MLLLNGFVFACAPGWNCEDKGILEGDIYLETNQDVVAFAEAYNGATGTITLAAEVSDATPLTCIEELDSLMVFSETLEGIEMDRVKSMSQLTIHYAPTSLSFASLEELGSLHIFEGGPKVLDGFGELKVLQQINIHREALAEDLGDLQRAQGLREVEISSPGIPSLVAQWTTLEILDISGISQVSLPALEEVGSLRVDDAESVHAPKLLRASGGIVVFAETADLSELRRAPDYLRIETNSQIDLPKFVYTDQLTLRSEEDINLPALTEARLFIARSTHGEIRADSLLSSNKLTVDGLASMASLHSAKEIFVGDTGDLSAFPRLETLQELHVHAGVDSLQGASALENLYALELSYFDGPDLSGLTRLSSLGRLTMTQSAPGSLAGLPDEIDQIWIYNCPDIDSLDGWPFRVVRYELTLDRLGIQDFSGAEKLEELGGLRIDHNEVLVSLDGLPKVARIDGILNIELVRIDGLGALTYVQDNFRVIKNAALTDPEIQVLLDQVEVGGQVIVRDNAE